MAYEFPVVVKAKLMLNCYTLFTYLLTYVLHYYNTGPVLKYAPECFEVLL